jgi:hypothetical protein
MADEQYLYVPPDGRRITPATGAEVIARAAEHDVLPAADLPAMLEAIDEARNGPAEADLDEEACEQIARLGVASHLGDRDPSPPNTLAIGSTWTGPDGTVYDVVAPGDVGDRPRWWMWSEATMEPEQPSDLHLDSIETHGAAEDPPTCALVLHGSRDITGELRAEVVELTKDRDAYKGLATRWETELGEAQGDALRLAADLGETRSQLESAQAACEASRKARGHVERLDREIADYWETIAARVSSLVAAHIVRTTGLEPALEGLGRIELRLVEGNKAIAKEKAGKRKAKAMVATTEDYDRQRKPKPKPARKAKAGKRQKAGR